MHERQHSVVRRLVTLTAAGSLAAMLVTATGCGQKGPLTLPASKAPIATPPLPASSPQ